ncbi:MAG: hypothetical protein LBJ92_04065 [Holosporales bacterium]|jgi:uncharacterized membrane protein YfcA|nr:hypothetical protein [Holosporales bacterium]
MKKVIQLAILSIFGTNIAITHIDKYVDIPHVVAGAVGSVLGAGIGRSIHQLTEIKLDDTENIWIPQIIRDHSDIPAAVVGGGLALLGSQWRGLRIRSWYAFGKIIVAGTALGAASNTYIEGLRFPVVFAALGSFAAIGTYDYLFPSSDYR